jgi:hypothetical protein
MMFGAKEAVREKKPTYKEFTQIQQSSEISDSVVECTDLESIPGKARKTYLSLTASQQTKINYWFGVALNF